MYFGGLTYWPVVALLYMVGPKNSKSLWRPKFMGKRKKRITSEELEIENLAPDLGIRASGRVLYWGPYRVGYIVGTRGSVIKVLYHCPVCGSTFSHARSWRYHMRVKHPDFLRAMAETSYELLEAYRARIRRLKGEVSGVTSTSSVSSLPATSSVPMSRPMVSLPPPIGLPVLRPPSLEELERYLKEKKGEGFK